MLCVFTVTRGCSASRGADHAARGSHHVKYQQRYATICDRCTPCMNLTAHAAGPVRTVTTSTARYAPYNRPMPPPNARSENVASSSGVCHSSAQPYASKPPMSSAVQPYVLKPPSLDVVPQQVCAADLFFYFIRTSHTSTPSHLSHTSFAPPPLSHVAPQPPSSALILNACQPPPGRFQLQPRERRRRAAKQRHHRRQQERVQRGVLAR